MNQDRIALKHILEGLVHNLNNPLNLILGYAQRLRQIYPESTEVERIYKAGLSIDDALKELNLKLWSNSFDLLEELDLAAWLSGELKYLQHYLPIKHHLLFVREDEADLPVVLASPLSLSIWYESVLGAILQAFESLQIKTGICKYQEKAALYIELPPALETVPDFTLLSEGCAEAHFAQNTKLQSKWEGDSRRIYGVLV